jgi:hypothetical protein
MDSLSISNLFMIIPSWHHANDDDVCKAIMRMQPLDGIPSFNVKGYSWIFAPLLKFILNLSLFTQTFRAA